MEHTPLSARETTSMVHAVANASHGKTASLVRIPVAGVEWVKYVKAIYSSIFRFGIGRLTVLGGHLTPAPMVSLCRWSRVERRQKESSDTQSIRP